MNRTPLRRALVVSLQVALFSSVLLSCSSEKSPGAQGAGKESKDAKEGKKSDRPVVVDGLIAKVTSTPVEVSGAGTLLAMDEVDLKVEAAGRIRNLNFPEGRAVPEGAVIAKIDDAVLQAQKARAAAQVQRFSTSLERKRQELALKAISQQELDLVAADLEAAKADLRLVDAQIRNTEVRAPFAGRLGLRNVSVGQVVTTGQIVARLTRSRPLRVELSVPEAKAGALKLGTPVNFKVMGKLETFAAKVDAIEPRFDEATRTIKLRARYDGNRELLAGSSVTVTLSQGSREGIFVPPEALSGDARGSILYVQKNGIAKAARVNIGLRDVNRIEVVSGIQAGDTVLVIGASGLRPGKPVKVAKLVPSP